jgi:hypothetical protein
LRYKFVPRVKVVSSELVKHISERFLPSPSFDGAKTSPAFAGNFRPLAHNELKTVSTLAGACENK